MKHYLQNSKIDAQVICTFCCSGAQQNDLSSVFHIPLNTNKEKKIYDLFFTAFTWTKLRLLRPWQVALLLICLAVLYHMQNLLRCDLIVFSLHLFVCQPVLMVDNCGLKDQLLLNDRNITILIEILLRVKEKFVVSFVSIWANK